MAATLAINTSCQFDENGLIHPEIHPFSHPAFSGTWEVAPSTPSCHIKSNVGEIKQHFSSSCNKDLMRPSGTFRKTDPDPPGAF